MLCSKIKFKGSIFSLASAECFSDLNEHIFMEIHAVVIEKNLQTSRVQIFHIFWSPNLGANCNKIYEWGWLTKISNFLKLAQHPSLP